MSTEPSGTDTYDFLEDPAERAWLTNLAPADVVANAHRFYEFMREQGVPADSWTRELAFTKASNALSISYDALDDAWMNEERIP